MQSSLTLTSIIALFSAMIVLAAIPSISVFTVVTRTASLGFIHGLFTTIGIVVGDLIFIIIAIWGLSFLIEKMGYLFISIKYLGGAYLIWLGIGLCKSKSSSTIPQDVIESSLFSSFLAGLSITLADQKATLFYLSFFPAFLELNKISYLDTGIIIGVAILAVGGVKLCYTLMADRARFIVGSQVSKSVNIIAGCILVSIGIFLFIKSN